MKDTIVALREENAALRSRIAVQLKVDKSAWSTKNDALDAVVRNLANVQPDDRERILMAAAVLYGIVKPIPPRKKPAPFTSAGEKP